MPEGRLARTRSAYDDAQIATCPICGEPLTGDNPDHGHEQRSGLSEIVAFTPASELDPPISVNTDDQDLWGV